MEMEEQLSHLEDHRKRFLHATTTTTINTTNAATIIEMELDAIDIGEEADAGYLGDRHLPQTATAARHKTVPILVTSAQLTNDELNVEVSGADSLEAIHCWRWW